MNIISPGLYSQRGPESPIEKIMLGEHLTDSK
jgi:hypothetical protein